MSRWNKLRAGFVSDKKDRLGLLAWWINLFFLVAVFVRLFLFDIFDYDYPIFSEIVLHFAAWLDNQHSFMKVFMFPLLFISLSGVLLTCFTLVIGPRKMRKWGEAMLIIGVVYIVVDLPTLIIVQCLNSPLSEGPFFWSQIFFDLLMLVLLILKIRIRGDEMEKEQP